MEKWNERKNVLKGSFAEKIVKEYLESLGYIVYHPITEGAHCFDSLAIKDKQNIIICEIKAKAKMNKYDLTGFEYKHYLEYKKIYDKYKIPIFIAFVDEMLGEIYGNFLSVLEKDSMRSSWNNGNQILFDMRNMKRGIRKLSQFEINTLKQLSSRNYKYAGD